MSYRMYRVFCATPLALEEEREAFYDVMAAFNEQRAMPSEILLLAVSLVPVMSDKRAYQRTVEENIRDSSYYILVWDGNWGPPERNFEKDWKLASESAQEAVMLRKDIDYKDLDEFKKMLWSLFERWLITSPESSEPTLSQTTS